MVIIGVNRAAIHMLLNGNCVFSAFVSQQTPWMRFCMCFCCVKSVQRKASRGLCLCLSQKSGTHVSVLATSCFPQGWSSFSSSSCPRCSLRHHHLVHIAGEDQFCCSTSRNHLEEEKGGTPYLRSSEGSQETGHSCRSRWCCDKCIQLSQRGLLWHKDVRWPDVFMKKSCGWFMCR